jgi:RNA polymerase sigma-70 factor (family 1)
MDETLNRDFKDFFLSYYNSVIRFSFSYIEQQDEVEDIAQETFVRLYQHWNEIKSEEQARAFMYTTAHNLCISHLRHIGVKSQYQQTVLDEKAWNDKNGNEEDESFFFEEMTYQNVLHLLYDAIQQLPNQMRNIILLSLDGKGNTEIAEELNVSINTVKTLKKNAYKTLRESLGNTTIGKELLTILLLIVCQA